MAEGPWGGEWSWMGVLVGSGCWMGCDERGWRAVRVERARTVITHAALVSAACYIDTSSIFFVAWLECRTRHMALAGGRNGGVPGF
eukprot:6969522-Prymnesium_polylepis.1